VLACPTLARVFRHGVTDKSEEVHRHRTGVDSPIGDSRDLWAFIEVDKSQRYCCCRQGSWRRNLRSTLLKRSLLFQTNQAFAEGVFQDIYAVVKV